MKRFYEIDAKPLVKMSEILEGEAAKDRDAEEIEVPNFVQSMMNEQEEITKKTLDD